ncbi:major facilitator superfamily domain-containing protein [Linnemannia elongata]|nr:major facilitator superfamily domain-containing protein [Linnemannia elongata]
MHPEDNDACNQDKHIVLSLETLSTHQPTHSTTSSKSDNDNSSNITHEKKWRGTEEKEMDENGLNVLTELPAPLSNNSNNLAVPAAAVPSSSVADAAGGQGGQFYPEGEYGWIVLAATFVCTFWCIGIVFCWGVFQDYLLRMETFGPSAGAKELSWVGSLSCACIFVAAPAIVVLITNFGTTTVLASGVLCVTTGFVAASFATTYWYLYITVGFLYGFGGCLIYFTCINVLARYFNKRRGVVVGVAISGSGIGSSVMAPLLHLMLSGAQIASTTGDEEAVVGIGRADLGRDRMDEKVDMDPRLGLASELSSPQSPLPTPTPTTASPAGPSLDFSLFKNLHYTLIFISTNLFALVYLVPILLTPTYATSIVGLPPSKGALMITIVSSVGIVSRIVIGHLADRYGTLNATSLCLLLSGLSSLLIWLHASHSFAVLATFMFFYGCFGGATIMLLPVAASKAVEGRQVPSALGFVFFAHTVGYLLGTPLVQFIIVESKGSFEGAIVFVGIVNLVCAGVVVVARVHVSRTLFAAY